MPTTADRSSHPRRRKAKRTRLQAFFEGYFAFLRDVMRLTFGCSCVLLIPAYALLLASHRYPSLSEASWLVSGAMLGGFVFPVVALLLSSFALTAYRFGAQLAATVSDIMPTASATSRNTRHAAQKPARDRAA